MPEQQVLAVEAEQLHVGPRQHVLWLPPHVPEQHWPLLPEQLTPSLRQQVMFDEPLTWSQLAVVPKPQHSADP